MPLPVLHPRPDIGPADLVRLYHRTELHYTRHLGEESPLDVGTAFLNRELPNMWTANRVLDAALPEGISPADAVSAVDATFAEHGVRCRQWVLNPAAPAAATDALAEHLWAGGWEADPADILHLAGAPSGLVRETPGLTIIPARASFRHARQIADEFALARNEPQIAEAAMLHLDDPHFDAVLAMRDGIPVGYAGVLAVGDVGRIDPVYVAREYRRRGIGRTIMSRAMEMCVRSQFRHVLLAVAPDNVPAQSLYRRLGFRRVGQFTAYHNRNNRS